MKVIEIIDMSKSYQDNIIFDKFNFEVEENTFNVVMGVSGSGKSTLVYLIKLIVEMLFYSVKKILNHFREKQKKC